MLDELLEQFVIEGRELVEAANDDLQALERGGYQAAHMDGAFRAIHTLKGSAGLFDAAPLSLILHAAEDLMTALRDARQAPGTEAMEALQDCLGAAEDWIEAMAASQRLPDGAARRAAALVAALQVARDGGTPAPPAADAMPPWAAALLAEDPGRRALSAVRYVPQPGCFFLGEDPLALLRAVPDLLAVRLAPRTPWLTAGYDPFACNLVICALSTAPAEQVRAVFRLVPDQAQVLALAAAPAPPDAAPALPAVQQPGPRTLRVDAGRIDALADLVGELFVATNRLSHLAAQAAAHAPGLARDLAASQAELGRLAAGLHRATMGLRMVTLDHSLRRLPRVARDVAAALGREVAFSIEGADTLADKTVADALFEPLLHVLRNAIDHGIEPPAARIAAGKPAQGRIVLSARQDGGQVVISLQDDGAGIDPAALRRSAAARGLMDAERLAALDDAAALDLVFLPGLSTAAAVTQTSGRGVGMDAVRAAMLALGGQASVAPAPGGGTIVTLAVAQTVAILPVVVVHAGGQAFGVPVGAIREMACIARDAILPVRAGQAFVLRHRTVPLLRLAELLGRTAPLPTAEARILVMQAAGQPVGLEVDSFGARLDVVLRPLPGLLAGLPGMRGSALLGDGSVLLVLDLAELVR